MLGDAKYLKTARLILDSSLFDSAFYAAQCADSLSAGASPVVHYLTFGRLNGLEPHPLFDTPYYLSQCPPLDEGTDPLAHYIETGFTSLRNPHPLFDAKFYCSQDIDISVSGLTPLGHYLSLGAKQGANPNEFFDTQFYVQQVPEVSISGVNPLVHYLLTGAAKGFDPGPRFHTTYYLEQNPDIAWSGINPLVHFLTFGRNEGRAHYAFFQSAKGATPHAVDPSEPALQLGDFNRLRDIEPLVPAAKTLGSLTEIGTALQSRAGRSYFTLCQMLAAPFSHLFLLPCVTGGPADQVLINMVRCVAEQLGPNAPLVLITDTAEITSIDGLPPGVRLYTLDSLHPGLSAQDKELLLLRLILQACPAAVTNINSVVGWNLYKNFGRQLATASHLAAWLFDYDYDSDNVPGGLPVQYLNQCIANLSYLFTESEDFREKLLDRFAFGEADSKKLLPFRPSVLIYGNGLVTASPSSDLRDVLAERRPCASTEQQFDISLVVNAHTEGRLLHPTVSSALEAIEYARADSLSVELLVVLDSPDPATLEYCEKFLPAQARIIEISVQDAGLARNAGVEAASGRNIAFLDGDDLFGRNWLLAAHRAIAADTRELVLHPSLIVYFEGRNCLWRLLDQEDPGFSEDILFEHNPWPALSFSRRATYQEVPFRATQPHKGFGYEDWLFNCDTVAFGIVHKVVPHTFHCIRQKTWQRSVLNETSAAGSTIADSDLFSLSWR